MNRREELRRHFTVAALTLPGAAIVWYVFHSAYANLTETERAVGYVDPLTQSGILMGYIAMVGGTAVLAAIGLRSVLAGVRLLLRRLP